MEVFDQIRSYQTPASKPWKSLQDFIGAIHDQHVLAEWFDRQARADEKRGHPGLASAALAEAAWAREKAELATTASSEAAWARAAMRRLHQELLAANPIAIVARGLAALGHASPAHPG